MTKPPCLTALSPTDLKRFTDPKSLPATTEKADSHNPFFGQSRAVNAINTALDIKSTGHHIFAVGENGLGKYTLITHLLGLRAPLEPTPPDLAYVHNFANPRCPICLTLPTQTAPVFAQEMIKLWHTCQKKLTQKFTSSSYQNQLSAIKDKAQTTQTALFDDINAKAQAYNLKLCNPSVVWQANFDSKMVVFTPIDDTKPATDNAKTLLDKPLTKLITALDDLTDKTDALMDELERSVAKKALEPLFRPLYKKYPSSEIGAFLDNVKADMTDNAVAIVSRDEDFTSLIDDVPARYGVNVLVSHKKDSGAPIVFEDMPTFLNLLGHIEHMTQLGTAYCDVSMIRAGALHRASGGYLILKAQDLLEHPYAWQGLKRALNANQLKISSLEQMLTLTGSLSLEPSASPLSVQVILLGDVPLYDDFFEFDPEFYSLFKIRADFYDTVPRTKQAEQFLVAKMADMIKSHQLCVFDNTACSEILDTLSTFADSQDRLDLHADRLLELLLETHRFAIKNSTVATCHDVKKALDNINERKGHLKELYWQEIQNGQQLISTQGVNVGQVNALTIIGYADGEFGLPARLTALVAPSFGEGEILDIERDVELGGNLHAKGMLIMTSYLRALFSEYHSLHFSASLAFEQSYGEIDGDSATLAEACGLLSALSGVPIYQNLAVTGSMNQLGQVQAVGGINSKIAGFFDVCVEQGLTGDQGVIIPFANKKELMLRQDIINTVKQGKFHIYAVQTVIEALHLLTGMPIDDKKKKGGYKKNTLFSKIIKRLGKWEVKSHK